MRFEFDTKHSPYSGETEGQNILIHLRNVHSHQELLDLLIHESLHAVLNKVTKTDADKDHYIFSRLDCDWF